MQFLGTSFSVHLLHSPNILVRCFLEGSLNFSAKPMSVPLDFRDRFVPVQRLITRRSSEAIKGFVNQQMVDLWPDPVCGTQQVFPSRPASDYLVEEIQKCSANVSAAHCPSFGRSNSQLCSHPLTINTTCVVLDLIWGSIISADYSSASEGTSSFECAPSCQEVLRWEASTRCSWF